MSEEREDMIVAEFAKNSREVIRVALGDFKGHELVHIRTWVQAKNSDTPKLLPTKSGIAIRRALLPELIDALRKAAAYGGAD